MAVFVDTNVFVYVRDTADKAKQARASEWVEHLWKSRDGRISFQVLQEYYWVCTQRLKPGLAVEVAREDVRGLHAWSPISIDGKMMESAWSLLDRYGISWWDALIVAAAQVAGCGHLLTEDLSDGQTYGTVKVVNPFTHSPDIAEDEFPGSPVDRQGSGH